ncbi:hypothetical protein DSECCO2_433400 [anaerobic digester metagenome]
MLMTIGAEVAGLPLAQVRSDVTVQVTTSLLTSVPEVNVTAFDPTEEPFTNHAYTGLEPPLTALAVNVTD